MTKIYTFRAAKKILWLILSVSLKLSQSTVDCRQTRMFLHSTDKQLTSFAFGVDSCNLGILASLLRSHIALNRNLAAVKIRSDPLW